MEQVNLHKLISKYLLLDEQAWALCFKSVKYIQTMYGSVMLDLNNSCESESVFCNLTPECIDLMEDGEINLDLKLGNRAAEENQVAAVKDEGDMCPPGALTAKSTNTSTGDGSSYLNNIGTEESPSPPVRFRSKFDRLRYEAEQAKKQLEAAKMKRIPSGALRPATMKGTDGSKSTSTVMGKTASPLSSTRGGSRVVDNTGTGDLPGPQIRFRSKFDRLRHEAQVKPEEEKEPDISGKAEAEVVLALGRMIIQSLRSRSESDKDPKLYDLLARMTGDLPKRLPLQRISLECEKHAKWEGDLYYTCVLRDLVSYYQVFIEKSISLEIQAPNIGGPSKEVDSSDMSDDSSDYTDGSNEEVSSTSSDSYDIDVELDNVVSEMQDTNINDAIMDNFLGAHDAQEKNSLPESVEIKSEVENFAGAEKNRSDDGNGMLSQEEPSKQKSDAPCSIKLQNDTTATNGVGALLQTDAGENNIPTKPGEIKSEIIIPTMFEKNHSGDASGTFSQEVPSEKKKRDMCDENTPNNQGGNMAAKSTGKEAEQQKVKQDNPKQESISDCEPTDKADKLSVKVNSGNVWRSSLTVKQMKEKMGIDQDKRKVKRNWTTTSSKGKTENTHVEETKSAQFYSTAHAEEKIKSQDEEKAEAGPTDGNVIPPISVNWGDVPEPWSAKLTVQQVKTSMGINEEIIVRPKKILSKKAELIMGNEDKDEPNVNFEQLSQEESAPTTINWGNVPEKWEANLTVHQVKAKMGLKERKVISPRRKSDKKKEPEDQQRDKSFDYQNNERTEEKTANPPRTVKWGNEQEQWAAQLNVVQIRKKMGIKEENVVRPRKNLNKKTPVELQIDQNKDHKDRPSGNTTDFQVDGIQDEKTVNQPITVKWGNEPEQWAAQLNLMQIKKKMGIKEETVIKPRKNGDKKTSAEEQFTHATTKVKHSDNTEAIEMETSSVNVIETGKVNDLDLVEATDTTTKAENKTENVNDSDKVKKIVTGVITTTMRYGDVAQKSDAVPSVFNLPSRGERLSKTKLEEIKAQLLVKSTVPKTATRKAKEEVKNLRTESELLLQLSASNQPKDARFLKSMLDKAGTYLNPFKWTKAKTEPAVDSSLKVEAVQSDLTNKKGWLPSGVSNVLMEVADVSVYAGLAYCGFYNVFSMETAFDLALIYSNLTSEPCVENFLTTTIASQAARFYLSPIGKSYLCPK